MAQQSKNWSCDFLADPDQVRKHDEVTLTVTLSNTEFDKSDETDKETVYTKGFTYKYETTNLLLQNAINNAPKNDTRQFSFEVPDLSGGDYEICVTVTAKENWNGLGDPLDDLTPPTDATGKPAILRQDTTISVTRLIQTESKVTLQRTFAGPTKDRALWTAIRNRTAAIGFDRYKKFINCVFCDTPEQDPFNDTRKQISKYVNDACLGSAEPTDQKQRISIFGPYAYSVLKLATQVFLTLESGVVIRSNSGEKPEIFNLEKERIRLNDFSLELRDLKKELGAYLGSAEQLPYLDRILTNLITLDDEEPKSVLPYCFGVLQFRLTSPSLIELIWSYWLEEGMLVQTMNAIALRFQNRRGSQNAP